MKNILSKRIKLVLAERGIRLDNVTLIIFMLIYKAKQKGIIVKELKERVGISNTNKIMTVLRTLMEWDLVWADSSGKQNVYAVTDDVFEEIQNKKPTIEELLADPPEEKEPVKELLFDSVEFIFVCDEEISEGAVDTIELPLIGKLISKREFEEMKTQDSDMLPDLCVSVELKSIMAKTTITQFGKEEVKFKTVASVELEEEDDDEDEE